MRKFLALLFCFALLFASCAKGSGDGEVVESGTSESSLSGGEPSHIEPIDENTLPEEYTKTYSLSFIAAGDNMAYFGNIRDAQQNAAGTNAKYDFKPTYTSVKPIVESYDLAFINQETLMCGEGYSLSYYPRFNSPTELGDAVVDAGFDIIGMANNHMLDKGESGLLKTLDYWESQDVILTGAYRNREAFDNINVIEKNGIKIALVSFTEHTNGLVLPSSSEVFIPYIEESLVAETVKRAEELADVTVVSLHFGDEFTFKVNDAQRNIANVVCENGGDVIIGHHPHTIQPVEWIEVGENKTLCAFSLGNFMSEMERDYKILGGMLSFNIEKVGINGKAQIKDPLFIPTVFDYTKTFYNNHIYLLEDYTEAQAKAHGMIYYGNRTTLATLKGYVTKYISEEFLPEFLKNNG